MSVVCVTLQSAAGDADVLDLEVDGQTTILEVKRFISKSRWEVPRACQTLLSSSGVVQDSDTVGSLCSATSSQTSLTLTMIVSVGAICGDLASGDRARKLDALSRLAKLGSRGGEAVVTAVSGCLDDDDELVKQVAIKALARLAQKGNGHVAGILCACVRREADEPTRAAALQALGMLTQVGDTQVIDTAATCLEDSSTWVRQAAVEALVKVARPGDPYAVEAVLSRAESRRAEVRTLALQVLGKVAVQGDRRALATAGRLLEDDDEQASRAALQALGLIALRGSPEAMEQVTPRLCHHDSRVRAIALEAWGLCAERGCRRALGVPYGELEDWEEAVRAAALRAVGSLAERGDSSAVSVVCSRLEDGDDHVKATAVGVLGQMVEKGDAHAVAEVTSRLHHWDWSVRRAATCALGLLAERGDSSVAKALNARLDDDEPCVRQAASEALQELHKQAIDQNSSTSTLCSSSDLQAVRGEGAPAAVVVDESSAKAPAIKGSPDAPSVEAGAPPATDRSVSAVAADAFDALSVSVRSIGQEAMRAIAELTSSAGPSAETGEGGWSSPRGHQNAAGSSWIPQREFHTWEQPSPSTAADSPAPHGKSEDGCLSSQPTPSVDGGWTPALPEEPSALSSLPTPSMGEWTPSALLAVVSEEPSCCRSQPGYPQHAVVDNEGHILELREGMLAIVGELREAQDRVSRLAPMVKERPAALPKSASQERQAQTQSDASSVPQVCVVVGSLSFSGDALELQLPRESTVLQLKKAIAFSAWKVPASCQRLLLAGGPLDDREQLSSHLVDAKNGEPCTLAVTMAISLQAPCEDLHGLQPERKARALRDLGRVGARWGGAVAPTLASSCLADGDADVREGAMAALREMCGESSESVLLSLCGQLRDGGTSARRAALEALSELGTRGDERLLGAVRDVLDDDWDDHVRACALRALGRLASVGDPSVVAAAVERLQGSEAAPRLAALEALSHLSPRGDLQVVSALADCLEDRDEVFRMEAMNVLCQVADRGDQGAVAAVCSHTHHWDASVRLAVLRVLGQIAERGNEVATSAARYRLRDRDERVQRAALEVLTSLKGGASTTGSKASLFNSESEGLRG